MNVYPGPGSALLVEYFLKTTLILIPALLAAAAFETAAGRLPAFHPLLRPHRPASRSPPIPPPGRLADSAASPHGPAGRWNSRRRPEPDLSSDPVLRVRRRRLTASPAQRRAGTVPVFPASGDGRAVASRRSTSRPPGRSPSGSQVPGRRRLPRRAIIFLWVGGLAVLLLRLAVGLAGAVRLTREGTGLGDPGWRILLDRFLSIVSLRRTIRLRSHPEVVVPLTWGWRKPVILLPAGAGAWAETERSSALFHELSHVKRADFLFLFLHPRQPGRLLVESALLAGLLPHPQGAGNRL